jgi:hypothetical protein
MDGNIFKDSLDGQLLLLIEKDVLNFDEVMWDFHKAGVHQT